MKRILVKVFLVSTAFLLVVHVKAGNPQRSGSAGASELLINPWARNTGWGGVNVAGVTGVEASFLNVAGTAHTRKTDVAFTSTQWLIGGGINLSAAGFNQKVGENGVLGANFIGVNYGDWDITTETNPDGGVGKISPSAAVIGLSYAQKFTESIYGGVNIKLFSQNSNNLGVSALCFDAGVQYVTGKEKEFKFGITLKNVGPSVSYTGDGKSLNLVVPQGGYTQAYEERSASFELPAQLSIAGSYDFNFDSQKLTVAAAFQSNSFEKDQYTLGAQYMIKELIGVRAGYTFFDNRVDGKSTTVFTGLSAGATLSLPLGDTGSRFGLDYSYRATNPFSGVHSIGLQFNL